MSADPRTAQQRDVTYWMAHDADAFACADPAEVRAAMRGLWDRCASLGAELAHRVTEPGLRSHTNDETLTL